MPVGFTPVVAAAFASAAIAAYFLGCLNGAVIISKYILKDDVRNHGSGNAGLTNFHRTFGGGLSVAVILLDVLKAIAALLLALWLLRLAGVSGEPWPLLCKYWAGLFCLLGHMFPCMFQFHGGKGVLSGGTIALMIDWRIGLAVWGIFLLCFLLTRYVSLGSVCAGVVFPVASGICYPSVGAVTLSVLIGALVVWQHRANISRLLHGTESKFHFHHSTGGNQ